MDTHNRFTELADQLERNRLTRRQALWLLGAGTVGALSGCAVSPVSGERILVGMSEAQERNVDRQVAPQQFSQDLGPVQDAAINGYVSEVAGGLTRVTHRPDMPYSCRVLNANYINAYTFPGGSVGVTRGILVDLADEAELAALIGHELGHVNARHAAQRQGQSMVTQVAVAGLSLAAGDTAWGSLIGAGGQVGASALLSSYSRDNEREADALGQEYMVRAGYPAGGMVRLHELLLSQEKETPSLLQTMFASHPMSRERRDTALHKAETTYSGSATAPGQKERFMDRTASLRKIKPTIEACQKGQVEASRKHYRDAETQYETALKKTPDDYAAHVLMAQCQHSQGKTAEALAHAEAARKVYPQEAQAQKLCGVLFLQQRDPARAYQSLEAYDRLLPGDPGITFLKGVALEGSGNRQAAAEHYRVYLGRQQQGNAAQYAYTRLKAWGYAK